MQDLERTKRAILDRLDIVTIVSEHVTLKRRGRRLVGLCPFHTEKTPSFTVTPELGVFKCFGCGKGGDVFSFLQLRENIPFAEALRMLGDRAGVEVAFGKPSQGGGPTRYDLAKVNAWAQRYFQKNLRHPTIGKSAREYLQHRGFKDETIELFGVGLAADAAPSLLDAASRAGIGVDLLKAADLIRQNEQQRLYDTFRSRLMFPILDVTKRVIGFGGRTMVDDPAKYINTRQNPLFDKGRSLFGIDRARDAIVAKGRAIIVEGYTDCTAAHQAGFSETVASLGTALTEYHVNLLRRYCAEAVLVFDSDDAGAAAAERAVRLALPRCLHCRMARIPVGKDPSDYLTQAGSKAFEEVLNTAVDALRFTWDATRERLERSAGGSSKAGHHEAVLDFLRLIAEAVQARAIDPIQRGLVVNEVAKVLAMDRAAVDRALGRLHRPAPKAGTAPPSRTAVVPQDQEQAGWVHFLEVALAHPPALASLTALPDPQRIVDQRDRRIAGLVLDMAAAGAYELADVLARVDDAEDIQRITDLSEAGARRGNFDARLAAALARIERGRAFSEWEKSGARERATGPANGGQDEIRDGLARVRDGARDYRGFSPRRLIRQARAAASAAPGLPAPQTATESP